MPETFAITASGTTVALDSARQGTILFTVNNVSGRVIRARGYVVADNASSPDWFTVDGETVRDFAVGGTDQYKVNVLVPADKPPGTYTFHFSVVGVTNPDEEFAQGPDVTFTVSAAPVRPPVKKGYMVALVGALIGAFAGGAIGAIPALLFILTTGKVGDFGEAIGVVILFVILAIIGAPLGVWLGSIIGTWFALKSRGMEYPWFTALVMAVMVIVFLGLASFIASIFKISNEVISGVLFLVLAVAAVSGAVFASRAITLFLKIHQV
ncbi:MAG: hypothetical protein ABI670_07450 [Chloroflexota bacterium]